MIDGNRAAGKSGRPRGRFLRVGPDAVLWFLLASLLFLPIVMMMSLSAASVAQMELEAEEISTLASGIRAYYSDNVIDRLQAAGDKAVYSDRYRDIHGGIPIPATLSIELGALFDNAHTDGRISYQFLSDYPFAKRMTRSLDSFQRQAIESFRASPDLQAFTQLDGNGLGRTTYRLATPILMRNACVTCHNSHPDSPKRDWKVGDVRGIQEVTVRGMRVDGLGNLGWVYAYIGVVGLTSVAATGVFRGQSSRLEVLNRKLLDSNQRESALAVRMAEQVQELSIFGSVVDHSIVGICIADMRRPDEPLIYVNKAFSAITGYSWDLAVGYNPRFLQGPDTDPEEVKRIRNAIAAGLPYRGDILNYRLDGSSFMNRLMLYPVGGSQPSFRGASAQKPGFYVANLIDASTLEGQSSSPDDELAALTLTLRSAQSALEDAIAAEERVRGPLATDGSMTNGDHDAWMQLERQTQGVLVDALKAIQAWLDQRSTGP